MCGGSTAVATTTIALPIIADVASALGMSQIQVSFVRLYCFQNTTMLTRAMNQEMLPTQAQSAQPEQSPQPQGARDVEDTTQRRDTLGQESRGMHTRLTVEIAMQEGIRQPHAFNTVQQGPVAGSYVTWHPTK